MLGNTSYFVMADQLHDSLHHPAVLKMTVFVHIQHIIQYFFKRNDKISSNISGLSLSFHYYRTPWKKTHVLRIITTSCLTFFCSYTKSSELLRSDTLARSSLSTYTIARIWSTFSAWIFAHDTRKSLQLSVHTPDPGGIARHFRSIWLVFTRHWSYNKRYTWRSWSPRSIWRYSWCHTRYSQCFHTPKTRQK